MWFGNVEHFVPSRSKVSASRLLHRYLAEAPANLCTPEYLARVAQSIAEAAPQVMTLEVLDVAACTALGMGCYLAVGAASAHIPHFIHLTYKPGVAARHLLPGVT